MVEAMANSVEDYLIDGLSFKLSKGASYVQSRSQATFWPSGSNVYKPTQGTRVVKIQINADAWLDPASVRICYDLVNIDTTAGKRLRTLGGPWTFWRRMRIACGGNASCEDIDYYNRTHEMFNALTSNASRENDDIEGFGARYDSVEDVHRLGVIATYTEFTLPGINPGGRQTVSFKPLSGLFSQQKYLPIRYAPITIELELVNDKNDPIITPGANATFTAAKCSDDWQIENVQLKCDLVTLDNGLENSYSEHLLSGKTLPINYNTYIAQSQVMNGNNTSINVSRALSRLKSVFVTMQGNATDFDANDVVHKDWNTFTHPMVKRAKVTLGAGDFRVYDNNYELEYQIQIGSILMPQYPSRSLAEAFYRLKQCVYGASNNFHAISFSEKEYRTDKFIIGQDCERVPDAGFTGINSKAGDLLTVRMKAVNPSVLTNADMPGLMHIVLRSDNIMEIGATGVQVFD